MYSFESREQLEKFISDNIVNTSEVSVLLECSRQYIFELVSKDKIKPVKILQKDKLFWKEDIEALMQKRKEKGK